MSRLRFFALSYCLLVVISAAITPGALGQTATGATGASSDLATSMVTAQVSSTPTLVRFGGKLAGVHGVVSLTFSFYAEQQSGAPLWSETQNVLVDEEGRYTVHLGAATQGGVPAELFATGAARWVGVRAANGVEQARVLLVSVPYAMKAKEAETLNGLSAAEIAAQAASLARSGGVQDTTVRVNGLNGGFAPNGPATPNTATTFTDTTPDQVVSVTQSGTGAGLKATTASATGHGIWGVNTSPTGTTRGVYGESISTTNSAAGVYGISKATTGVTYGVVGITNSTQGTALNGTATAATGATIGLRGQANSTSGTGLQGASTAVTGNTTGVNGFVMSPAGTAAMFDNRAGGKLLSLKSKSVEKLSIDGNGNLLTSGLLQSTVSGFKFPDGTVQTTAATSGPAYTAGAGLELSGNLFKVNFAGTGATDAAARSDHDHDLAYLRLNGGTLTGPLTFAAAQTFPAAGLAGGIVDAQILSVGANKITGTMNNVALPDTASNSVGVLTMGGEPFLHNYNTGASFSIFLGKKAGNFATSGWANTSIGYQTLNAVTEGSQNSAFGAMTLLSNTTGSMNTAIGTSVLAGNQAGSENTAIGFGSLFKNNGDSNTALGSQALNLNTTGSLNSALGHYAGRYNTTGTFNLFLGTEAGPDSAHGNLTNATAIGAYSQVTQSNSLILGGTDTYAVKVGVGTTAPTQPLTVVGTIESTSGGFKFPDGTVQSTAATSGPAYTAGAGLLLTGNLFKVNFTGTGAADAAARSDHNHDAAYLKLNGGTLTGPLTFAGTQTFPAAGISGGIVDAQILSVGANKITGTMNNVALPDTANTTTGVLTLGGVPFLHGYGVSLVPGTSTFLGRNAGVNFASTGYRSTGIGYQALKNLTSGGENSALGADSLELVTTGYQNSAFGTASLYNNISGGQNSAFGVRALFKNDTGYMNTAVGFETLLNNTATANTAVGAESLFSNTTGYNNSTFGYNSLNANVVGNNNSAFGMQSLLGTTGSGNSALGVNAGRYNTTGSNNLFLGASAGPDSAHPGLTNAVAIGANALVTQSSSMILGGTGANAVSVGIGTSAPTEPLTVAGTVHSTSGGFMFPDGTTQTTAATTGTTYNAGAGLTKSGTTFAVDFTGSSGAANTVARTDHNHDAAYLQNVTAANGVLAGTKSNGSQFLSLSYAGANGDYGTAVTPSRSDHIHDLRYDSRYLRLAGGSLTGTVSFAAGQTFPGVLTGVAAGNGGISVGIVSGGSQSVSVNYGGTGAATSVSRSDHNHDSRYLSLSGGTVTGGITASSLYINNTTSGYLIDVTQNYDYAVGIRGSATNGTGVIGYSPTVEGVLGSSTSGTGVRGSSASGTGVKGETSGATAWGVLGTNNSSSSYGAGVYGLSYSPAGYGVMGYANSAGSLGVWGRGNTGVRGESLIANGVGVYGASSGTGYAVYGYNTSSGGYAGGFTGNVLIAGVLVKSAGSFKIDHPLDPEHKYLSHSFVESPDMKNIYDGVVVLDANGEAVVELPDWFQALNRDFRYQLTSIGAFMPVYVAEELADNRFKIAGGKAGGKVSWLVTGIRQDAFANAHRIPVEEMKPASEQGKYLQPEVFGKTAEMGINRAPTAARPSSE